ncbi:glycosyl hydrolase [Paenibacillus campi]|uniref:WD40/YVTN/BNR-like repeat-containing protein n=1 Tax=Paenibacillus campi TaxID=3106031 RepID=UPI002AFDEDB3|nr:glycosyl hydrolase [Paenibacillus sp. SGZ-1009]
MMTKLFLAFDRELLIAEQREQHWHVSSHFKGAHPVSLAADPHNQHTVYCATFDRGLWKTVDGGHSWEAIDVSPSFGDFTEAKDYARATYTTLNVAAPSAHGQPAIIYAGTEPSSIVYCADGSDSFVMLTDFAHAPSKANWFFPPRPYTHHVKHIEVHRSDPNLLYATIEVGGLFYSTDRGATWSEAVNAPRDIHRLCTHAQAPARLYGALGDSFLKQDHFGHAYAESIDHGLTWEYNIDGLEHHYAYDLAVHPQDPDIVILATSSNPQHAHDYQAGRCESFLYRKQKGKPWTRLTDGLPDAQGSLIPALCVNAKGDFYAFNNKGVYRSVDRGLTWQSLNIPWQTRYMNQHPYAIIVLDK